MTPRDWFTVGLRLFGIWQLIYAIVDACTTFAIMQAYYRAQNTSSGKWYALMTVVHFVLALWLLKSAPQTARFFYREAGERGEGSKDAKPSDSSTPNI
jgi:hypothetical protein